MLLEIDILFIAMNLTDGRNAEYRGCQLQSQSRNSTAKEFLNPLFRLLIYATKEELIMKNLIEFTPHPALAQGYFNSFTNPEK